MPCEHCKVLYELFDGSAERLIFFPYEEGRLPEFGIKWSENRAVCVLAVERPLYREHVAEILPREVCRIVDEVECGYDVQSVVSLAQSVAVKCLYGRPFVRHDGKRRKVVYADALLCGERRLRAHEYAAPVVYAEL